MSTDSDCIWIIQLNLFLDQIILEANSYKLKSQKEMETCGLSKNIRTTTLFDKLK